MKGTTQSILKKSLIAIVYVFIGYMIYVNGEAILRWFQAASIEMIILVIIAATLMSLFPIIPYPVIGGFIGAAFGPLIGFLVIWLGSSFASIFMFSFVRYGYQDWGMLALQKYKTLNRATLLFEKNAFLAILFSRMILIIPSIVINIYSAISRVAFWQYTLASSLGKVPSMLLLAFIGNDLVTNPRNLIITISIYVIFLSITLLMYKLWTIQDKMGRRGKE